MSARPGAGTRPLRRSEVFSAPMQKRTRSRRRVSRGRTSGEVPTTRVSMAATIRGWTRGLFLRLARSPEDLNLPVEHRTSDSRRRLDVDMHAAPGAAAEPRSSVERPAPRSRQQRIDYIQPGGRRRPVLWGSQSGPATSSFCSVFFLNFFRAALASGLVTVICELFFAPLPKRVVLNANARRMLL
jgi:hypothetical protein